LQSTLFYLCSPPSASLSRHGCGSGERERERDREGGKKIKFIAPI